MKLRRRKVLHCTVPPENKEEAVESVVVPKLLRRNSKKLSTNGFEVKQAVTSSTTKLQKVKERKRPSNKSMTDADDSCKSDLQMQRLHAGNIESSAESSIVCTDDQPRRLGRKQTRLMSKRIASTITQQTTKDISRKNSLIHRVVKSNSTTSPCSVVLSDEDKILPQFEKSKYYRSSIADQKRPVSDRLSKNDSIHSIHELSSILEKEFGSTRPSVNYSQNKQPNFNISPCSVGLPEEEVSDRLTDTQQHQWSDTSHTSATSDRLGINEDICLQHVKELNSVLDEEFAFVNKHNTRSSHHEEIINEEENEECDRASDGQQECDKLPSETSSEKANQSKKFYRKKPQKKHSDNSSLASWLATGQRSISKTQIKTFLDLESGSKMKRLNTRTPLQPRQIGRLASTPHLSPPSDTNCEEDLFGFENLLKPIVDLPLNFSPIPNPSIRKSLRKKISPFCAPKKATKQWDGILDVTTSHFNAKPKRKTGKKHVNNDEEVIELSDVCLFEDAGDEFQNENDFRDIGEYCFDEDESPSKPKRYKQNNKAAPKIHFNIEDQLPWKEIMEHELVIESV